MSEKYLDRWKRFKFYMIVVAIVTWLSLMIYALRVTPSTDAAAMRLTEMQKDVDAALVDNGWVTKSSNESKFGGAMLYRVINGSTIDGEKKARIKKRLVDSGWRATEGSTAGFCKNGMLLTFHDVPDSYYGHPASTVSGEFNARTIKTCALLPAIAPIKR